MRHLLLPLHATVGGAATPVGGRQKQNQKAVRQDARCIVDRLTTSLLLPMVSETMGDNY